ncbi:FecR family protein [Sinomicrobium sp. M5D2P17]
MKNDILLAKWLSGEISEEELEILKKSGDLHAYEKIATYAGRLKAPPFDKEAVLQKIQQASQHSSSGIRRIYPWKRFAQIAAVISIALVSYIFLRKENTVISTANAEKTNLVLPDESRVILNAGSVLTYNRKKWDEKREVQLEGEGFFKVVNGSSFDVKTSAGTVSVLGTEFNVKNRENYFEVSCYKGSVMVIHRKDIIKLIPGETFKALEGEKAKTENTIEIEPSWLRDESSFKSVPYTLVLKEFERQYNVHINVRAETNLDFTGSFSNKDIETALKSITLPFRLKYKFTDGKKDEITIYTDKD